MTTIVTRYHDFSCAHRAVGDPGHCSNIHGHNYRVHFEVQGEPNDLGRVVDFYDLKMTVINWIEENWDHKLLLWNQDPLVAEWISGDFPQTWAQVLGQSIVYVHFNTSTENMAKHLAELTERSLRLRLNTNQITVTEVRIEETRKCGAIWRAA